MGLLRAIADAVYREYDRRIKRASQITEYGQHHHDHGHDAGPAHVDMAQADMEAEIINVPPGTPVAHEPASAKPQPADTH
jgi:hypothetical protein